MDKKSSRWWVTGVHRDGPLMGVLSGIGAINRLITNHDPFQRTWPSGHCLHVPAAQAARHIPLGDPEAEPEHMGLARDGEVGFQRWSEL